VERDAQATCLDGSTCISEWETSLQVSVPQVNLCSPDLQHDNNLLRGRGYQMLWCYIWRFFENILRADHTFVSACKVKQVLCELAAKIVRQES
jgi:hypothetical protein